MRWKWNGLKAAAAANSSSPGLRAGLAAISAMARAMRRP
jgi:hypothetical protein